MEARTSLAFRPDVEGLRALAIVLVVLSHAGLPFFASGFIGVDVFFVLSGYLITALLFQEIQSTGGLRFSRFYARRARRLLPAAMLLATVVCLVEAVVVSPIEQFRVVKAAAAALLYCSNVYFAQLGARYFDQGTATSPLLHTWSLAVEEQFYLLWPVLLLALTRVGKNRRTATVALAVLALTSFAFCVWLTAHNPTSAFFQLPPRVWEFCTGALLAMLPAARVARYKRVCAWIGYAGLVSLLLSAQWIPSAAFPGSVAAFPVLGTMAVLLAGIAAPQSLVPRILSTRPAQILGGLSYSLYLWHWPAIVIGSQLFPSNSLVGRLAAILAAVLLAFTTHRLLENPVRFHPYLVARSGLTLKLAGVTAALCACALCAWGFTVHRSAQFQKYDRVVRDVPEVYSRGCVPERPDPQLHLCTFGETRNPRQTVVLYGDSHAAEWFPALNQIAAAHHWKIVTMVKPGCSPLNFARETSPFVERVCAAWRQEALGEIERLHPDIVFISTASLHPGPGWRMMTDVAVWQQVAHDTLAQLAQRATQVRFIRDTPHADYNVMECLAQSEWNGRTRCPAIEPAAALYPEIYAAEVSGAAGIANVGFLDLSDAMCGPDACYPEIGEMVVYRDNDHLTATFNRSLAALLDRRLAAPLRP